MLPASRRPAVDGLQLHAFFRLVMMMQGIPQSLHVSKACKEGAKAQQGEQCLSYSWSNMASSLRVRLGVSTGASASASFSQFQRHAPGCAS